MSTKETKFDIWWNSPEVKSVIGKAYSLGASIVIIGAMFKILHLTGAEIMLGIGMSVEAFLFGLGILDKPLKEYEWDKVYDFEGGGQLSSSPETSVQQKNGVVSRNVGLNYTESISDDDVKKLSEGIKNLSVTAQQFAGLSSVVGSTDQFVKNIDSASHATGKFAKSQEDLNTMTSQLSNSYKGISDGMDLVEKNTKQYASKIDDINKNLASINSIYEIQLKNIQAQSENLTQQNERLRTVNDELGVIIGDVQKMKIATTSTATETEKFKAGTTKLAQQVTELNQVYGNMLNSLS
ncbi:MAG: gliding motility protein GldL [Paludibacter sp.]